LANNLVNTFGNAIKQGTVGTLTGNLINSITGQPTQQPTQRPTVRVPPKKVDVSTLTPFTGQLPPQLTGTTTPTSGTGTTTPTGGLGQTTNTTQTPTQTTNSGLTSTTQPKTPPQKVDVSTLKPVTDMNWLKSIGLVQG
jgi:hypothetical protein